MLNQRLEAILTLVNQQRKVSVADLAQRLDVSLVTMRKDLTTLEEQGLLRRHHGYALANDPDNLNFRLAQNYEVKSRIAVAAADLVPDQATIMIESGSTCALLAARLGEQGKRVTLITNSYYIADYVAEYSNLTVFVLGGRYQANAQVTVGPLTQELLKQFHVTQLFAGTDGFDPQWGFSSRDIQRNDIVRAMATQAETVTLLTDSTKFAQPSLVRQFTFDQVDRVITDRQVNEPTAVLLNHRVTLNLV